MTLTIPVRRAVSALNIASLAALLLLWGATTSAEVQTFEFEGTVGTARDETGPLHDLFGDLSMLSAQTVSGSFAYDSMLSDSDPSPTIGSYQLTGAPGCFLEFKIAGRTLSTVGLSAIVEDLIWDKLALHDDGSTPVMVEGVPLPPEASMSFGLVGPGSALLTDALPAELNLNDFSLTSGWLADGTPGGHIAFAITSLTARQQNVGVPDAGNAAFLLLLSFPAFGLMRRIAGR